uniref:Peptidase S1 domain-containing protein n=1 Tax=Caenorhabditis tropicalis TaxID=1561998 RepID=A0A1I7V518_9PELO
MALSLQKIIIRMGFSTTVFLFLLALVATCHSSSPFNKLSNEENKILLEHCGLISPMTQRKIYGGTVVPETESVFTVKVVRDGKILSGVLVSPRHVITSINEEAATFDNRSCVGQ